MSLSSSSTDGSFTGLIRRYLQKVSAWAKLRVGRYGLAFGLLAIGTLLLAVALAIGTAAGFYFIELRYGIWTAYGVVGGSFAGLAAVALIAGWIILKAKPPAMPAPPTPAHLMRRAVAPMALKMASTANRRQALAVVDQRRGLLAAGAALLVVGWIASRQKDRSTEIQ